MEKLFFHNFSSYFIFLPFIVLDCLSFFFFLRSENRLDLEIGKRTASKLEVDLKVHGNFSSSIRQLMLDTGKATVCSERHNIVPVSDLPRLLTRILFPI